MVVKGRSKRKIKTITNFIWPKIGLKPVIQIDFSPFCVSVLFDFTLPAPLMASKITRWTFLSLDISSLMIWISYKTNMPTWLPLSSSKGSSSWLPWIVFYPYYPYSGAPEKYHAALKPILRGQDLDLGHINRKHVL